MVPVFIVGKVFLDYRPALLAMSAGATGASASVGQSDPLVLTALAHDKSHGHWPAG